MRHRWNGIASRGIKASGRREANIHRACEQCPVPWIEALAVMGRVNPFFEKAGFARTGGRTRAAAEYFIRDNRGVRATDERFIAHPQA
jgi:hypothetical protein